MIYVECFASKLLARAGVTEPPAPGAGFSWLKKAQVQIQPISLYVIVFLLILCVFVFSHGFHMVITGG